MPLYILACLDSVKYTLRFFLPQLLSLHPDMNVKLCMLEQWYYCFVVFVRSINYCCLEYSSCTTLWQLFHHLYLFFRLLLFLTELHRLLTIIWLHSSLLWSYLLYYYYRNYLFTPRQPCCHWCHQVQPDLFFNIFTECCFMWK